MINLDSLTLKMWIDENSQFLTGARIQKIQQPTRREFVFYIRNHAQNKKMYISINPQFHHVCFMSKENEAKRLIEIPQKPPMFCMLLRKYLENAVIAKVSQPPYERILEFYIETFNELSEKIYLCLAIEFMGKHSNVVLYNYDTNLILGCAHNVGAEKSKEREMAGGLPYVYPPGRPNDWYAAENSLATKSSQSDINQLIDDYYSQVIYDDKFKKRKDAYKQIVSRKLKKSESSYKKMQYTLEKEYDCDKYRLYGDLIMANLYNNNDYSDFISVYDYENNKEIKIELDETRTLIENANQFYKLYNKGKTALTRLTGLTCSLKEEMQYYEQILYSIEIACEIEDLNAIKSEVEPEKSPKDNKNGSSILPLELNMEGYKVFVGRNNKQNDFIVSKLSKDEDYWFHTKDCAGSHVLLKCENPSNDLILKCARLAKEYSKGKMSSKVGVIYTKRKYLKKPPKANLGYVIYKNEREIIID